MTDRARDDDAPGIVRLVGIYNADGTLTGEVAYVVGKLLGRAHCALCDITHGIREKQEWKACRAALPVPFDTIHRDERTPELAALTGADLPCVVAETTRGLALLLTRVDLERCEGNPEALVDALEAAAQRLALHFDAGETPKRSGSG
jgi:hypothetical protein